MQQNCFKCNSIPLNNSCSDGYSGASQLVYQMAVDVAVKKGCKIPKNHICMLYVIPFLNNLRKHSKNLAIIFSKKLSQK